MRPADSLTAAEAIAVTHLTRNGELEVARDALAPSVHEIDVTIRVRGPLVVGEDREQRGRVEAGALRVEVLGRGAAAEVAA